MTQAAKIRSTYLTKATADRLARLQQLRQDLDMALHKFKLIMVVGFLSFAGFSIYLSLFVGFFAERNSQIWAFAITAGVNAQLLGLILAQAVNIRVIRRRCQNEFEHLTWYRGLRFRRTEEAQT